MVKPETLEQMLDNVNKKIDALGAGHCSLRDKGQVRNLIDKIKNRQTMPDFESILSYPVESMQEAINKANSKNEPFVGIRVSFTEYLDGIKVDVSEDIKIKLKTLETERASLMTVINLQTPA